MTFRWPSGILRARDVAFDIAPRSLAGPSAISGAAQVVASDAGIWKATLGNILIRNRTERITFRAVATLLEGRLNPILIPLCRADQPIPEGAEEAGLYDAIPHSDGSFFDDGGGYAQTIIDVTAAAGAALRATSITITPTYVGDILAGQHFSIGERLYRVRGYNEDTHVLTFRPPLREAVTSGDHLNFDDPVGKFRLASDSEMDLELAMRRSGSPTVSFIEDV
jgi:hypothetical protein